MVAFVRFLLILLVVQTVFYFALTLHYRRRERARLGREWRSRDDIPQSQDDFVEEGMSRFSDRLSVRLAIFVYILPLGVLGTIIYLTNTT